MNIEAYKLKNKINSLTNELLVTESHLLEAYRLGTPSNGFDEDSFLATHAVLANKLNLSVEEIQKYLNHFVLNIGLEGRGFVNTLYRLYHDYVRSPEGVKYLTDLLGIYNFSVTLTLLNSIDDIDKYSYY